MIVRSAGHVITDVPGVREIRVQTNGERPSIEIDYATGPTAHVFGVDSLGLLIQGLRTALGLAQGESERCASEPCPHCWQ